MLNIIVIKLQIKTTMRCDYMPIKMAKIQKTYYPKCCRDCGATASLIHHWWRCKMVFWKTVWQFLTKLNSPTVLTSNRILIYPTELKTYVWPKTRTHMFRAALFIIANNWHKLWCPPVCECVNKLWNLKWEWESKKEMS